MWVSERKKKKKSEQNNSDSLLSGKTDVCHLYQGFENQYF